MSFIRDSRILPIPIKDHDQDIIGWSFRVTFETEGPYTPFVTPSTNCLERIVNVGDYTNTIQDLGVEYTIKPNIILFATEGMAKTAADALIDRIALENPKEMMQTIFEFNKEHFFGIKQLIIGELKEAHGDGDDYTPSDEELIFYRDLIAAIYKKQLTVSIVEDHHTDEDLDLEKLGNSSIPIESMEIASGYVRPLGSEGIIYFSEITGFYINGKKVSM